MPDPLPHSHLHLPPKHQPKPLAQGEVVICQHRITADWNEEGQRILKAGIIGRDGAKVVIEVEAWNASLAHLASA